MNRDDVRSVYSDARTEYTKQLCMFLVPAYFQFFVDLLQKAKQTMIAEPRRVLWQFQTYLNEIHDWNVEKVSHEIQLIHTNCGCDYLEDLLTAVFIAHTKVLTAIRLSANHKKVEITIPKVDHFLFKVLCESSKLLWSNTYLFRDGISSMEKQQNYRMVETMLNEGVLQAVRGMVPVKSILKDFVNNDAAEDSDEDDEPVAAAPPVSEESVAEPVEEPVVMEEPAVVMEEPAVVMEEPIVAEPTIAEPTIAEPTIAEPTIAESIQSHIHSMLAKAEPQTESPVIIIDDKPNVRFGQFDAVFHSDPDSSDMIYDPKEDHDSDAPPVLEIMDEEGTTLSMGVDFDSLDPVEESGLNEDDYDTL